MPMNPELKKKWVDALRSGEYKQGKIGLYNYESDAYCCLGVLCELAGFEKLPKEDVYAVYNVGGVVSSVGLSAPFIDRIEFPPHEEGRLISMNDSKGKSFSEIADYIESNL